MRLSQLTDGWRSEFIVHRHDALISERDDCIVVRTPGNPTYYWGNCLLLPALPRDADLPHWLARFHVEITAWQRESQHAAFGINTPGTAAELPTWQQAGFELLRSDVMQLQPHGLRTARRARGQVLVRPADLPREAEAFLELQCTDTQGHTLEDYRDFRRLKMAALARMRDRGDAQWFGLWCDGTLAANCGLVRDGTLGRFQHVLTHPAWRRRGLCSALVHAISDWGFRHWQLERITMIADPDDVAIGIYRSLGYATVTQTLGLERRAA